MSFSLSPSDRIIKNTVILQRDKPFFSYILMNFETRQSVSTDDIPTMGISKYGKLYWNEEFIKTLNNAELQYVLCHEVLHVAKGDIFRMGKREPLIWNIAADCIINDILNVENMTPPKLGYIPDKNGDIKIGLKSYKCRNRLTEDLYDELISDVQVIKIYVSGKEGPNGTGHGGFDQHVDKPDGKEEKTETTANIKAAESKWKKITVEAATIAQQRGKMPGCASGILDKILNPVVDWRSRLRSFVTNEVPVDYCNRLPGRKFYATGAWCPRTLRENISLFVSIDCSGSTMNDRVRFTSEIQGIVTSMTQLKARLIFWSYGEINENNDIEIDTQTTDKLKSLKLSDINGGTELSSYNCYLEKKCYTSRLHIILTDGHVEPKPIVPQGTILFVLCGQCTDEIVKNYGECIFIRDETEDYKNG